MKSLFWITAIWLLIFTLFNGCEDALENDLMDTKYPLMNTWKLTSVLNYQGEHLKTDIPEELINTITFYQSGEFKLNTFCNEGGGYFRVTGDSLEILDLLITEKACVFINEYDWERIILYGLSASTNYYIMGNKLTITNEEDYELHFELYTDTSYESYADSSIYGIWEWQNSCGGIVGECLTVEETLYNQSLEISFSGDMIIRRNDSIYHSDKFYFDQGYSIFSEESVEFLRLEESPDLVYSLENDTLILNENCFDCFQHTYVRSRDDYKFPNYLRN